LNISNRCPTLIIHGTDDRTIPFEHGIGLYDAIPVEVRAKPFWMIGKGHNNIDYNSDQLIESLSAYLEQHVPLYRTKKPSSGFKRKLSSKIESRPRLSVSEG
jgi:Predicted hydrolases or acyltransferases (alpha/beta hydrolase superfamily)